MILFYSYGVVQRMAAFGLTLNSSCYAALIRAYKNRRPINHVTFEKVSMTRHDLSFSYLPSVSTSATALSSNVFNLLVLFNDLVIVVYLLSFLIVAQVSFTDL